MTQQSHSWVYIRKKKKNPNSKRYMHPNVPSSIIYDSQGMEATYVSIDRWIDKEDVLYTYNGILLSHRKDWNFAIRSNTDGLGGYYAKWNKSDKDKYCMISLICGI